MNPLPTGGYLAEATSMERAMAPDPKVLSADDVLDMPLPDGVEGYELVDGQPVPVTAASFEHGRLIVEVAYLLRKHLDEHALAGAVVSDAGSVLGLPRDPERMRAADVAYIRQSKVEAIADPERLFRGVPDLVIEIDLASAKKPGGQQRVLDYLEGGVPLVWVIEPYTRTAMAYRPDGTARLVRTDEVLDAEEVVPGFRLPLGALFG